MLGKVLRFVVILLMGLTVAFHLFGGIGTFCIAVGAEKYPSMADLVDYKWLYQLFVIITLAVSIYGIRSLVKLIKGRENAYRDAFIFLVLALLVSGAHMCASETLRGASAPANMRVYFTLFTLAVFLLMRIPGIWEKVNAPRQPGDNSGSAAGMTLLAIGGLSLTVQFWTGSSHIMEGGINFADSWHSSMSFVGWSFVILGIGLLSRIPLGISMDRLAPKPRLDRRVEETELT